MYSEVLGGGHDFGWEIAIVSTGGGGWAARCLFSWGRGCLVGVWGAMVMGVVAWRHGWWMRHWDEHWVRSVDMSSE